MSETSRWTEAGNKAHVLSVNKVAGRRQLLVLCLMKRRSGTALALVANPMFLGIESLDS